MNADVSTTRELMAALPALSVRQPWATSIVLFGKPVENRGWDGEYLEKQLATIRRRGPRFLIHASKGMTLEECANWRGFVNESIPLVDLQTWPQMTFRDLPRGGIIGVARFVDWVTSHASPWFVGPGALLVADAAPLPFVPCVGTTGFFYPKAS